MVRKNCRKQVYLTAEESDLFNRYKAEKEYSSDAEFLRALITAGIKTVPVYHTVLEKSLLPTK